MISVESPLKNFHPCLNKGSEARVASRFSKGREKKREDLEPSAEG